MNTLKKCLMWMLALLVLQNVALFAQTLTGTWQGTLQLGGKDLRVIIKIATTDADTLKGTMYSIDQSPQPIPTGPIVIQGSTVKVPIPLISGNYEGKLSADGNSISGTWSQGQGNAAPMTMTRATDGTAWSIPEPPVKLKPMKTDFDPTFEVATIKPAKPNQPGKGFTFNGRKFVTINTSLSDLMTFAYDLHQKQIVGAPAWFADDKYDILGDPNGEGMPSMKQCKIMLQKLMADRFKLTFHREKKELSVYALVVAKTGAKMTKSEGDPNGPSNLAFRGLGFLPGRNANMPDFASVMQMAVLDRPVVDQTGIAGKWDFDLKWTADPSQFQSMGVKVPPPSDDPAAPPDLFTAIVQQMGLKLEAAKAPVEVLVVDKVEKPSEN